ncbi:hypothetical protein IWW55_007242, partial [Coemansia sp. RSA 2706]
ADRSPARIATRRRRIARPGPAQPAPNESARRDRARISARPAWVARGARANVSAGRARTRRTPRVPQARRALGQRVLRAAPARRIRVAAAV